MKKNSAQSILEIVAMLLFLGATIFIGGPTIIRGINAHFKLWDDSVQDSYNDPLKQAPVQNLPADCVCDPPMGGPGLRCGVSPCLPTERLETILCNPVGCGSALGVNENYCVDDTTCCDIYLDTNLCGTGTTPPPPAWDCPLGERITQRACGGGTTQFGCRIDTTPSSVPPPLGDGNPTCIPHCLGVYNPTEAAAVGNPTVPVICPGDDVNITSGPWVQDVTGVGITIIPVGNDVSACSDPQDCQAYCSNCYILWGAGCVLSYTSPAYIVAPNTGPPSPGSHVITINDKSFSMCFQTAVFNANSPGIGCGPVGTPGTSCTITAW